MGSSCDPKATNLAFRDQASISECVSNTLHCFFLGEQSACAGDDASGLALSTPVPHGCLAGLVGCDQDRVGLQFALADAAALNLLQGYLGQPWVPPDR